MKDTEDTPENQAPEPVFLAEGEELAVVCRDAGGRETRYNVTAETLRNCASMVAVIERMDSMIEQLQGEKAAIMQDRSGLQAEVRGLEGRIHELDRTIAGLRTEKESLLDQIAAFEGVRRDLQDQIAAHRRQLNTVRVTLDDWVELANLLDDLSPFSPGYQHAVREKKKLIQLTNSMIRLVYAESKRDDDSQP
jgi:chromosome segregation ATPase